MANKYSTGSYIINIYDKHGTKQHSEYNLDSYIQAKDVAQYLTQGTNESYVVLRVLDNSID